MKDTAGSDASDPHTVAGATKGSGNVFQGKVDRRDEYLELAALIDMSVQALSAARNVLRRLSEGGYEAAVERGDPFHHNILESLDSRKSTSRYRRRGKDLDRAVELMPRAGRNGAAILLRLLDEPGKYVTSHELVQIAGIRSSGIKAVKVYVCHLRASLQALDFPADTIETGRGCYRLNSEVASRLSALIPPACGDDPDPATIAGR